MSTTSIIIADDHQLFKKGLRALLEEDEGFEVVAEASNGKELLLRIGEWMPDVALVDITMPEMSGLEAIPEIKKLSPRTRIIMLTMHEDGEYITESIKKGAHGYLLKNADEDELKRAIRLVAEGKVYYNSEVSQLMIQNLSREGKKANFEKLTTREVEILELVSQGLSNKVIADQLFISIRTVETHRLNMIKKMGVNNTTELVKKALEAGVIK
ncbi:MAG: response regulator transcription factor [Cytophagales bacterium]|nr:response regulator transcription factor [Cytophagales bacterium]